MTDNCKSKLVCPKCKKSNVIEEAAYAGRQLEGRPPNNSPLVPIPNHCHDCGYEWSTKR